MKEAVLLRLEFNELNYASFTSASKMLGFLSSLEFTC